MQRIAENRTSREYMVHGTNMKKGHIKYQHVQDR